VDVKTLYTVLDDREMEQGWETSEADEEEPVSMEHSDLPETLMTEADPELDQLVAQYFGDVRKHALLSWEEEKALWQRIESLKRRVRRALFMSPVCWPALQGMWQQVQREELSPREVLSDSPETPHDEAMLRAQLDTFMLSLEALAVRLQPLRRQKPGRIESAPKRQEVVSVWHEWIAMCEAMPLQPSVYETLRRDLDAALSVAPDEAALRAAHSGWNRAQQALEQAKARMLQANLRLVIYIAKRYRNEEVLFLDLIQEGNIGLMRALDKFEPDRGLKFVTYAHWWVRQAIGRAIIEQRRTIRLPSHVVERKNKLRTAETKLWQVLKRAPTVTELSGELGWTPQDVTALNSARQVMVRLHEPMTDEGQRLEETMEDHQTPELDVLVAQGELQHHVAACLSDLPERESHILQLRFGLNTDHPHSLKEIGDIYGLSRERIRQLETLALKKLRTSKSGVLLSDFVDAI
jgi:RNA polymerase primary sigma factor